VDAQLSPALAKWIEAEFDVPSAALRDMALHDAKDMVVFNAVKQPGFIILTKDADFLDLLERLGSPPHVIWLTCGNTSNAALRIVVRKSLSKALKMIEQGEQLVEITGHE